MKNIIIISILISLCSSCEEFLTEDPEGTSPPISISLQKKSVSAASMDSTSGSTTAFFTQA